MWATGHRWRARGMPAGWGRDVCGMRCGDLAGPGRVGLRQNIFDNQNQSDGHADRPCSHERAPRRFHSDAPPPLRGRPFARSRTHPLFHFFSENFSFRPGKRRRKVAGFASKVNFLQTYLKIVGPGRPRRFEKNQLFQNIFGKI